MTVSLVRFRLAVITVVVGTTVAGGWQVVDACSCVAHLRTDISPQPGAVGVPRNASIRFTVGGSAGTTIESHFVGSYLLQEIDGSGNETEEIGTIQELTGNRVVITPTNVLSPNSRFRLTLLTERNRQDITDFVTGGESLRPMLKEFFGLSKKLNTTPEIANVVGLPGRPGSPACEGHTQGYLITIRVPIEIDLRREHYDWLINEIRDDGLSVAMQRSAIQLKAVKAEWSEKWQQYQLVVGHSQCGSGPVPKPGGHAVVVSLVGLGEIAWTSDTIHVNVPSHCALTPRSSGPPPGAGVVR